MTKGEGGGALLASDPPPFERGLDRNAANFVPLSPVGFLERSARVYPRKVAVRHGRHAYTYSEFHARCRRLASALARRGIGRGDTVAIMAPNIPPLLEAHYAVPALGAVLNPLNVRLDARTLAVCLDHGEAKLLFIDAEFAPVMREALALCARAPIVVDLDDSEGPGHGDIATRLGALTYETLLSEGDPAFAWPGPRDEWDALALLYTSGTTGDPKGVVYHHRGAYLNALGNALAFRLGPESVYLWTLPMFHCSGWTYTWAVTVVGGTHVCLRRVEAALIFTAIAEHRITHLCGAPIVLNMLVHAPPSARCSFAHTVDVATGGAAPPSAVIQAMEKMGFRVTHLYGLTESYGPATLCAPQEEWAALDLESRARQMARQGVPMPTLADLIVADPDTAEPVARDGAMLGEVMLRGNTIMKGYLKNAAATQSAFAHGWYHTGDLAVWHPDGYIEIKDRSKDIIISGGENISSLEVEECLYRHPQVVEAAVVARPDPRWGESPCAFVMLKPDSQVTAADIIQWCRDRIAHFKVPKQVVFGPLPKTATGKIQKNVLRERAGTDGNAT
jgi:fatty-acyl-CoA synthase